ncbi:MAG: Fic family protein [Deltaproteobacteria bacterium]|nr:Fic family protein [Deltaproteobacteria bacterium]
MLFESPKLDQLTLDVIERLTQMRMKLEWASGGRSRRWGGLLRRNAFARVIQGSNSIEGYSASPEDAVAAVDGDERIDASQETWDALVGYRQAMTYVIQLAGDPHFSYSSGLLRALHFMMTQYDLAKNPGRWRPGYITVRNSESGNIVYEAPDAELIPELTDELVQQLNQQERHQSAPVLVRGALSHLNLVMIHPFSNGNGRMARCLQSLVLARENILAPVFCSIEEELARTTLQYYRVLEEVGGGKWNPHRDLTAWIRFNLQAHFTQAKRLESRMRRMDRLWGEIERIVAAERLPDRVVPVLCDAACGYSIRNSSHRLAAEIPQNLASRDLKTMVDKRLLVPRGEKRGRRYSAAPYIRKIWTAMKEEGALEDPFETTGPSPRRTSSSS